MSKEYVWELEIDDDYKIFKCVVTDTEVITYEGNKEYKHLKITNPVKKIGVLQLDTETKVYGEMVPIRVEKEIPYLLVDGRWIMSDTTRDERLEKGIMTYRRNGIVEISAGVAMLISCLVLYLVQGSVGTMSLMIALGFMCVFAGVSTLIRLKQELDALVEAEKEKAADREAKRAAKALEAPQEEV